MTENDEDATKKKTVNAREIEPKSSSSPELQPPDVCKTPSAPGPIPIPYPNIAKSSDTSNGSKKVKVDGKEVSTKGSDYVKSTGDEAGTDGETSWDAVEPTTTKSLTKTVKEHPLLTTIIILILVLIVVVYLLNSPPKIIPVDEPVECIRAQLTQTINA